MELLKNSPAIFNKETNLQMLSLPDYSYENQGTQISLLNQNSFKANILGQPFHYNQYQNRILNPLGEIWGTLGQLFDFYLTRGA